jgi:thiol-disulfide isomerase/thioredoxin
MSVSWVKRCLGLAILFFMSAVAWPVLAADEKKEPGDKPAAEKPAAEKPAAEKPAAEKPAAEKPAKPADPFAVPDGTPKELEEYVNNLVKNRPRDAETRTKMQEAILKAAEKMLAGKPNEHELEFAVQAKMNMLKDPEKLAAFAEELKKGGQAKLARQVSGFILITNMQKAMAGGPEKIKKSIADAVKFLEEEPPQLTDIGLAFTTGQLAEMAKDQDFAVKTYQSLAKVFSTSKDEKLVEISGTFEGVVRRLSLMGNEMKIEGKILGGAAFDWSKYAGKVVLVDFWATWCPPCVAEVPNMKKCYELYHSKGFDIVGLSCDRNLEDLEKFVKEKEIPWTIVFGDGKPSPTVSYYGIMGIPTMVLVGKDGKVVSLNARGEELKKELEKILGPVEEKKDEKKADKKEDKADKDGKEKKADDAKKS